MPYPSSRRARRARRSTAFGAAAVVTLGTLGAAGALTTAPASAATPAAAAPSRAADPGVSVDVRRPATAAQTAQADARTAQVAASAPVARLRAALGSQALVDVDSTTLTPRNVAKLDGFLTAPSSAQPADVALGFVRAHADLFRLSEADLAGLSLARDYVDVEGITHLSWVQRVGGVALFGNGLKASVAKDGSLINVQGSPVPGLRAPSAPVSLSPDAAITAAKTSLKAAKTAPVTGDTATRVLFAVGGGTRPAYQVVDMSSARPALSVVDAETGRVLYRESITSDAAAPHQTAQVYTNYPTAPKGGTPQSVDLTAKGWLPAGAVVLYGNNSHTYTDINDDDASDPSEEIAPNAAGSYAFSLQPQDPTSIAPCATTTCTWRPGVPYSWQVNRSQTAVQNFFYINNYHDHLAQSPIGFTEAAGNFQQVNTTGKGLGGDAVQDEPLDGAAVAAGLPDGNHIDNANFATPPDGTAPRMQMYLFHQPGAAYPTQDPFLAVAGSDESDVVYHEYTHGLSNRLVVGPDGVSVLNSQQGGSMGEAWSDWYALDYLVGSGLRTDKPGPGDTEVGQYLYADRGGIRTEGTDCTVGAPAKVCPGTKAAGPGGYTYGDFGKIAGGPEVHADGEIWAQTLWDLRGAVGATTAESIVTRAMELSPAFPSYLDMRNAILQADQATRGGRDTATIWKVFAHRGMGFFAGTVGGDDVHPVEDFSLPPAASTAKSTVTGRVTDSESGAGLASAVVAFGGHDSGFPGSYSATTDAQGRYTISGVFPGRYPDVYAAAPGYDAVTRTVAVKGARTTLSFALVRDWAAASGGASIAATNGNEYAAFGCGVSALIDQGAGGWVANKPTTADGKYAVIALPTAVDVSALQIDPAGTGCGLEASGSTASYRVETSKDGSTFTVAATGTFTKAQIGVLNTVPLKAGTGTAVKAVRYTMLTNQVGAYGSCPGLAGCTYIGTAELQVQGRAH